MKKLVLCLVMFMFILTACGNLFQKINPTISEVKDVVETVKQIAETVKDVAESVKVVASEEAKRMETVTETEETEVTEGKSSEVVNETEAPEGQNEFFDVLDTIANVHPGTAGSSLKVAAAAYKFINNCRAKLPFDLMAGEWVKKQDKNKFSDINESFAFVYESLDQFKDNKMIKGLLSDAGIDLPDGVTFDGIIDEAKNVLQVIINATK